MIKEKLKKSISLMLASAMVLTLVLPSIGSIKAYADGETYEAGWPLGDYAYSEDGLSETGIFKSAASTSNCTSQTEQVVTPTEIQRYDELVERYDLVKKFPNLGQGFSRYAIGNVIYNSDENYIAAAKSIYAASENVDVYLVVQGRQITRYNDGREDYEWGDYYYRIKIDEVMGATCYTLQLDREKGYDVDKCKIWLEADCGNLLGEGEKFYAVEARQHTHSSSKKVWYAATTLEGKLAHAHGCDAFYDETYMDSGCPELATTLYDLAEHTMAYVDIDDLPADMQQTLKENGYSDGHFYWCTVCKSISPHYSLPNINEINGNHDYSANKYSHDKTEHWIVCELCNHEKENTREEHNYSNEYTTDDDYHWHSCTDCYDEDSKDNVESGKEKHDWDDNLVCKTCRYDLNQKHNFTEKPNHDRVEPTCTEVGYEAYWKCTDAGCEVKKYEKLGVQIKFSDMSEIEIDMVDHTEGDIYAYNSSNHWKLCTVCGAKIDGTEAAHIFDKNVCTVCGYKKSNDSSGSDTGWIKDNNGWKYRNSDGILAKGSTVTDANGNKVEKVLWQRAGSGYFAFGANEYLVSGWIFDSLSSNWYYCDENKGMIRGWLYDAEGGHWYYLDPSTGAMRTGWQNIDGKAYYFAGEPAAPTYSFDATAKKWIYNNQLGYYPFGSMYANTVTPDNYEVDASGAWIH